MSTVDRKRGVKPVYYPESDGLSVGETFFHRENLFGLIEMLQDHYQFGPTAYVTGNMFLYFVEGDPKQVVCPDVYLCLGVEDKPRQTYCTWLEGGKGPDLVVELTSRKAKKEDAGKKFLIYQDILRVREYFRFDPLEEYLNPALQGHRLVDGVYVSIEPVDGRLPSEVTGLHFFRDGTDLKVMNPETGETFLTVAERRRERRENYLRLEEQARQVLLAEQQARLAEVQARLIDEQARLVEAERRRADDESRRAEAERLRAEAAAAEVERLRVELEELRRLKEGGL